MSKLQTTFGASVKAVRKFKSITGAELARKMGVSRAYISQVERGDYNVTLGVVEKFAESLECPAIWLLTGFDA